MPPNSRQDLVDEETAIQKQVRLKKYELEVLRKKAKMEEHPEYAEEVRERCRKINQTFKFASIKRRLEAMINLDTTSETKRTLLRDLITSNRYLTISHKCVSGLAVL